MLCPTESGCKCEGKESAGTIRHHLSTLRRADTCNTPTHGGVETRHLNEVNAITITVNEINHTVELCSLEWLLVHDLDLGVVVCLNPHALKPLPQVVELLEHLEECLQSHVKSWNGATFV